jgi:hypothetical protein
MSASEAQVPVEGTGGLRAERNYTSFASLAAPDHGPLVPQVDVVHLERADLLGSCGGLQRQPDNCLITPVPERLPLARLQ